MFITNQFFAIVMPFAPVIGLVVVLDVIGICLLILSEKFDPRTFVCWLIALLFIPLFGFLIYVMFGCTWFNRKAENRKGSAERQVSGDTATEVHLIPDDDAAVEILTDIISKSKSEIDVQCIPDTVAGRLVQTISEASKRGVDIRVLGSHSKGFGDKTLDVEKVEHRSFSVRRWISPPWTPEPRYVRSAVMVDRDTALVGDGPYLMVKGVAARSASDRFDADWDLERKPKDVREDGFRSGGADVGTDRGQQTFADTVCSAKSSLVVAIPYILPGSEVIGILSMMSRSGVDVDLVVSRENRFRHQFWNTVSAVGPLLTSGVKVHVSNEGFRGSLAVADGSRVATGSLIFGENEYYLSSLAYGESDCVVDGNALLDGTVPLDSDESSGRNHRTVRILSRFLMHLHRGTYS